MTSLIRVLSISAISTGCIVAAELGASIQTEASWRSVVGPIFGLVLGLIQLAVGLGIAAFAINKGLQVVSRLLGGLDIWGEIKKRNVAVALLAAGAVISYTRVIGAGVDSMTKSIASLVDFNITTGLIGMIAGLVNLTVAIAVASFAITVTFKVMDRLTKDIDEKVELSNNNVAIGAIYCGILIGVSGLVASGVSGIGIGVDKVLTGLAGNLF